jgi:cyanophycinase
MEKIDRTLIIIGGKEDRSKDKLILREVAERVGSGKLVVTTVAMPGETNSLFEEYDKAFRSLGVEHVHKLEINSREEATLESKAKILRGAKGVFFTGGDQVKITSQIGDTAIFEGIRDIYNRGGVIAGTSAGASVMCETMLVVGGDEQSYVIGGSMRMAPGLSIYNLRMHMLSQGDRFDLITREPRQMKGRAAARLPEKEEEQTKTAA